MTAHGWELIDTYPGYAYEKQMGGGFSVNYMDDTGCFFIKWEFDDELGGDFAFNIEMEGRSDSAIKAEITRRTKKFLQIMRDRIYEVTGK